MCSQSIPIYYIIHSSSKTPRTKKDQESESMYIYIQKSIGIGVLISSICLFLISSTVLTHEITSTSSLILIQTDDQTVNLCTTTSARGSRTTATPVLVLHSLGKCQCPPPTPLCQCWCPGYSCRELEWSIQHLESALLWVDTQPSPL